MKASLVRLGACLCAVLPVSAADDRPQAVDPSVLIERLGDERYPVREKASYELWGLGVAAREVLAEAADSRDPEVAMRASTILRRINLDVLPDSPPAVVELVLQYDKSGPEERRRIVQQLKRLRAWRQVLRIHALEQDAETLELIGPETDGVAVKAAREALARETPDFAAAREFLELGRPEPAQLISLAEFHRVAGSLDREIERAKSLKGEAGPLWRMAMQLAKGDEEAALKEAEAAGQDGIAARLQALAGDPRPWLERAYGGRHPDAPVVLSAYREGVLDLWNGGPVPDALIHRMAGMASQEFDEDSAGALRVLFALGASEEGEAELQRRSPSLVFLMHDSAERIDRALAALGLDPEKPDFAGWAAARWEVIGKRGDVRREEFQELRRLGCFLERRGGFDTLREMFREPLAALAEGDEGVFIDLLGELFNRRYGWSSDRVVRPALEAAAGYVKEDDARWAVVLETFFPDEFYVEPLREWIGRYRPEATALERLELLTGVLGEKGLADDEVAKWWAWIDHQACEGPEERRAEAFGLMLTLRMVAPDGREYLRIIDEARAAGIGLGDLGQFAREYAYVWTEATAQAALGDWDAVVEFRRKAVERDPADPRRVARYAAALRRAGRAKEADRADARVELLVLGDVVEMRQVGKCYATYGESGRAAAWWRRAVRESVEDDRNLFFSAALLAGEMKERSDWISAAALSELFDMYTLFELRPDSMGGLLRARNEIEMLQALDLLGRDREAAVAKLEHCREVSGPDGALTDYLFPALRAAGLVELHERYFEELWNHYNRVVERYPGSHNTLNTMAWTAARANRRLDEAEAKVLRALELHPGQPAYLDTCAEIWFCRGHRKKAVEWSDRAVSRSVRDDAVMLDDFTMLMRQNERFRNSSFPLH